MKLLFSAAPTVRKEIHLGFFFICVGFKLSLLKQSVDVILHQNVFGAHNVNSTRVTNYCYICVFYD